MYFYIEFYQDFTISRGAKNVLRYLTTPKTPQGAKKLSFTASHLGKL